jgi:hypothetical protein
MFISYKLQLFYMGLRLGLSAGGSNSEKHLITKRRGEYLDLGARK